jgi:hypothetical protein
VTGAAATRPPLDGWRTDLDDVDLAAIRMRIDLLLEDAAGLANVGSEGVQGGYNLRSDETGMGAMVFEHSDSISADFRQGRRLKANSSFQMPADDETRAALRLGEPGVAMIVERWRAATAEHLRMDDGREKRECDAAAAIVSAILHQQNPDYPKWNKIEIAFPTWAAEATVQVSGKPILTAQAQRAVGELLPRLGNVLSGKQRTMILPLLHEFRFEGASDPIAAMRTIAGVRLDMSKPMLRKAGMERRP